MARQCGRDKRVAGHCGIGKACDWAVFVEGCHVARCVARQWAVVAATFVSISGTNVPAPD